jgi:hypothetical protein
MWRFTTAVGDITLYVEEYVTTLYVQEKAIPPTLILSLHIQSCSLFPTSRVMSPITELSLQIHSYSPLLSYQEMVIWKSTVTLIYRELLALGRKIDIFKLIYRYLLAFGW